MGQPNKLTTELTTPENEEMLKTIDEHCYSIKNDLESAKEKFIRLCLLVSEKGYSPNEVWQRIKENLKDFIPERTLYRWADTSLPEGSKLVTKPKKIATWQSPNQETKIELPNNDWLYNKIDLLKRENASLKTQLQLPTTVNTQSKEPEAKEIQGRYNIAPEEYKLEELDQYDKDLLIEIVRYLHNKVQTLRTNSTTTGPTAKKQEWLLGK